MLTIFAFLEELKKRHIYFKLDTDREETVMVMVFVPGQYWECEFFEDGHLEVEIYKSDGKILGEEALKTLYADFSD